jgi:hypothetical protein
LLIPLPPRLRFALCLVRQFAMRKFPRVLRRPAVVGPEIFVYADACTRGDWSSRAGGWGFIIMVIDRSRAKPSTRAWFAQAPFAAAWESCPDINPREFANLCFAAITAMRFPGSRIILYTDSEVAAGWFNSQTTSSLEIDLAMAQIRRWAEERGCELLAIHIPGETMPADKISRRPFGPHETPVFPRDPPVVPPQLLETPAIGSVQWAPQCAAEAAILEDHMVETPAFASLAPVTGVPFWSSPPQGLPAWSVLGAPCLRRCDNGHPTGIPVQTVSARALVSQDARSSWVSNTHGPASQLSTRAAAT